MANRETKDLAMVAWVGDDERELVHCLLNISEKVKVRQDRRRIYDIHSSASILAAQVTLVIDKKRL